MKHIGPEQLKSMLDNGDPVRLVDVREPEEMAICQIDGSQGIPMLQLFTGMTKVEADPDTPLVVYCHRGIRSIDAAMFLEQQGFQNVSSLNGGIDGWAAVCDPSMPRY